MAHLPLTILARQAFIQDELAASAATKSKVFEHCADTIIKAVDVINRALLSGRKILLCGNGGSAVDAQHLATELVIRLDPSIKRPGIPAIALTTDSSMLTAGANDIGYDNVFARAVEALGSEGDVLIGISTSGRSESVNMAARGARANKVAGVSGIPVLNINQLANALKPVVLPGELMRVSIVKEGKEAGQGVGYLEDGTMVVVDNASRCIGRSLEVTATSAI